MKRLCTIFASLLAAGFMAAYAENPPTPAAQMTTDAEGNISIFTGDLPQIAMKKVKGGTFSMGALANEAGSEADEKPAHLVTLSDFAIGRYEVTQELWEAVMGSNPADPGEDPQTPIYNVSWTDVQTFLTRLNQHPSIQQAGFSFRLPTEAEWEYAARGGKDSKGYRYAGSNQIDSVAWYRGNSQVNIHPVGKKQPNELNLYDMTGNVFEWCSDWYDADYYKNSPPQDPKGPQIGTARIVRGGCWSFVEEDCRITYRATHNPESKGLNILGLRLAMDLLQE